MILALLLAYYFLALALGEPIPPEFAIEIYRSARDSGWLIVLLIGLCVGAPVIEEFVVRGFMFRGWSQSFLGPAGAVVLSSVAWAAIHTQYDLFYMSEIFAIGLLLGYLRYRSGSTWLTVVIHGAVNAASMIEVAVVLANA
ncbi:MAG: CPBP family intramembrane metalloprotease [Bradyrhizobium sp.]|nr:CPBP family intramembrane metalloprotease [Bradyrhizobium sp.]